jgi:xanthine/uracil permease
VYYGAIVIPAAIVASAAAVVRDARLFIVDAVFVLGTLGGIVFLFCRFVTESVGLGWAFLSPGFVWVPVTLYVAIVGRRVCQSRSECAAQSLPLMSESLVALNTVDGKGNE